MILRYFRVLGRFWGAAIAAELEYRLNFFLAAISSLGNFSGSLFSLFLFYRTGYSFEGWPWEAALLVVGIFTLLEGFSATLLSPNLNRIVTHVQTGTLDFVLLKPISSQFWLSTRSFSLWGLPDFLLGLGLVAYAGQRLELPLQGYLLTLPILLCSFLILYSLWFALGATSIWFVKVYNVTEVLRGLVAAGRFPMAAYPAAYRFFFTFIVPVAFLTTVPAQTLRGEIELPWLWAAALLAAILMVAANQFWRFALRFYTSASS